MSIIPYLKLDYIPKENDIKILIKFKLKNYTKDKIIKLAEYMASHLTVKDNELEGLQKVYYYRFNAKVYAIEEAKYIYIAIPSVSYPDLISIIVSLIKRAIISTYKEYKKDIESLIIEDIYFPEKLFSSYSGSFITKEIFNNLFKKRPIIHINVTPKLGLSNYLYATKIVELMKNNIDILTDDLILHSQNYNYIKDRIKALNDITKLDKLDKIYIPNLTPYICELEDIINELDLNFFLLDLNALSLLNLKNIRKHFREKIIMVNFLFNKDLYLLSFKLYIKLLRIIGADIIHINNSSLFDKEDLQIINKLSKEKELNFDRKERIFNQDLKKFNPVYLSLNIQKNKIYKDDTINFLDINEFKNLDDLKDFIRRYKNED